MGSINNGYMKSTCSHSISHAERTPERVSLSTHYFLNKSVQGFIVYHITYKYQPESDSE